MDERIFSPPLMSPTQAQSKCQALEHAIFFVCENQGLAASGRFHFAGTISDILPSYRDYNTGLSALPAYPPLVFSLWESTPQISLGFWPFPFYKCSFRPHGTSFFQVRHFRGRLIPPRGLFHFRFLIFLSKSTYVFHPSIRPREIRPSPPPVEKCTFFQ